LINSEDRNLFLANIDKLLNYSLQLSKQKQTGQIDLFGSELFEDKQISQKLILDNSVEPATQTSEVSLGKRINRYLH